MSTLNTRSLAVFLLLLSALSLKAQEKNITADMLSSYRSQVPAGASEKAISNALAASGIAPLSAVSQNNIPGGTYFSHRIDSKGITDQKKSGRCWLFTGLNILRAKMIQKFGLGKFEFSQSYLFFYDQLEKSNLFLQSVIDNAGKPMDDRQVDWLFHNPLSDGGQFTGIADLITKYGLVPAECMPETSTANGTSLYGRLLSEKLREFGLALRRMAADGASAKKLAARKQEQLQQVYNILVRCFGMPPQKFTWTRFSASGKPVSTKEYTPLQFYQEYVAADLKNNYLMFMNDPTHEYYKTYEIDLDRHVYDGSNWTFLNVPIEDLKAMAISSIKDTTMMYLSCDVAKFYDSSRGYADPSNFDYASLLGTTFPMDKHDRILTFASGSSHAMTLMAVDLDENQQPRKWMVENSWGNTGYEGHIIMSDRWFSEYVFRLVVEKKYVSEKLLKFFEQTPIKLPAWDPLFAPEQ